VRPGWTDTTVRAGDTVIKRHLGADAPARHAAEIAALTRLPAAIPVPALLGTTTDMVTTRHVGGVPRQDLVAGGLPRPSRPAGSVIRR
jgi:hypothetical protein